MIVSSCFKLGKSLLHDHNYDTLFYHIFDRKTIIYVIILCHLAYDTFDPIFMVVFICSCTPLILELRQKACFMHVVHDCKLMHEKAKVEIRSMPVGGAICLNMG